MPEGSIDRADAGPCHLPDRRFDHCNGFVFVANCVSHSGYHNPSRSLDRRRCIWREPVSRHPVCRSPGGSLRWLPPQPPAQFKGTFQATQPGNPCTQSNGAGGAVGSEDCLTLNVYVPDIEPPEEGFPVMVWIHGGGLVKGSGADYDPTPIVEKANVIVVTINYRLGYLGFFAHPAIDAENRLKAN